MPRHRRIHSPSGHVQAWRQTNRFRLLRSSGRNKSLHSPLVGEATNSCKRYVPVSFQYAA